MTAAVHGPAAPTLRLARGFSCLFWSLPLLAAAHAAALGGVPASEALRIQVSVTAPDGQTYILEGWRTRYAPNALP